jgi:hypothetical protein
MWRPQYGARALEGAEATVFAEALWSLLDEATAGTHVQHIDQVIVPDDPENVGGRVQ